MVTSVLKVRPSNFDIPILKRTEMRISPPMLLNILIKYLCNGQGSIRQAILYVDRSCSYDRTDLTVLHSERPKLYIVLAFLRAIGLKK